MPYDARTEQLLALLPTLTKDEFARLALACADQAGLPAAANDRLAAELNVEVIPCS